MLFKKYKIISGYVFKRRYLFNGEYDICDNCLFSDKCKYINIKDSLTLNDVCPPSELWNNETDDWIEFNNIYTPIEKYKNIKR
jgi:hypothetical protein